MVSGENWYVTLLDNFLCWKIVWRIRRIRRINMLENEVITPDMDKVVLIPRKLRNKNHFVVCVRSIQHHAMVLDARSLDNQNDTRGHHLTGVRFVKTRIM
jgi:hypothetical protein